jgi:RNA polymerase sigma-70 factor (ECF subfamily)
MYRITANASYTHVQKRKRLRTTNLEDVEEPVDARLESRPEAMAESVAGLAELTDAVDRLPQTLRQIVILKDVYGLPHEAIAEELGISVAAAKVRLHRGRKKLRDLLDEVDERSAHAV